ncbi:MAG: aminotransferase class I/II-fold pyridoxal phosphate-dependent enzyme [Fimbriimonadaceae bacterium]|nr:aminotransferase class I/II-fold pyridoxal phosphate-dependent enzyme [Fimbriimonadaceae bacterium]QYK55609.1 MAG: aminotransferase class I/II-fold pyridoxal phosphate-dependent enzyme [Fimbriimonadaceae bacterium]
MPQPARRLNAIPPYLFAELSEIKRAAASEGIDVIDLGIGDPDTPTPPEIVDALCNSARNPETHRYDESSRGWPMFLQACKSFYQREFGVGLDAEKEIMQVIGSKEGLAHLAWTYAEDGDTVIVPNPAYSVYKVNAVMAGANVHEVPLRKANAFLPILDDIPTDIARKAKLFYVCYPNNPTGAIATRTFYEDFVRFCREYDILAVNDMAYGTIAFDGFKNPTMLQVEGGKDVGIEFHSLSKMYNMTGWRIGFACGNPDAITILQKLKSNIDSKQFPAISEAAALALSRGKTNAAIELYKTRRDVLVSGLRDLGWAVEPPKASFFVWAEIPEGFGDSMSFAKELLRRTGVAAVPGSGFGDEGEGYIRFALTLKGDVHGERYHEVLDRIAKAGFSVRAKV